MTANTGAAHPDDEHPDAQHVLDVQLTPEDVKLLIASLYHLAVIAGLDTAERAHALADHLQGALDVAPFTLARFQPEVPC